MNATELAAYPDEKISDADRKHAMSMERGSRLLAQALGYAWTCNHIKTPETTHTIDGVEQCKVCRRRRWMHGFKIAVARRVARDAVIRERVLRQTKNQVALIEHALNFPGNGRLPLVTIKREVCHLFEIDEDWLTTAPRATKTLRDARAVIYKILRERGLSYPAIAKTMGGRDHSTIIYALQNYDDYAARNPLMSLAYLNLRDKPCRLEAANDG